MAASRTSVEQAARPRAGGIEEVAVAARRVGPLEPGPRAASSSRRVSSSKNGDVGSRRGSEPCSRPITKTASNLPRAGAREVEHRHAAGLARGVAAHGRPVERGEDIVGADRDPRRLQTLQLVEDTSCRLGGAKVALRDGADRRSAEAVGVPRHRQHDLRSAEAAGVMLDELERLQEAGVAIRTEDVVSSLDRATVRGDAAGEPGRGARRSSRRRRPKRSS